MNLASSEDPKSIAIELGPFWRLKKNGEPFLGSLEDDQTIIDTLTILKDRKMIDFSMNAFLDFIF